MVNTADWKENPEEYAKVAFNELFVCVFFPEVPAGVIAADYNHPQRGADLELDRTSHSIRFRPGSVDMLIDRAKLGSVDTSYSPSNIPGTDQAYDADDVHFNTCLKRDGSRENVTNTDNRGTFYPYMTVVHEAGHTFGLSGFNYKDLLRGPERNYVMSHLTIPDTVMNYDDKPGENRDPATDEHVRFEPDCSPHPFDLMALHALYQTVSR